MMKASAVRLALALSMSGFLLAATAGGRWGIWPSSLLWAAPLLVAMRCLPVFLAVPIVVVVSSAGRAVAFGGSLPGSAGFVLPLLASLVLLPALFFDKVLDARFPRASLVVWPLAIAVTVRVVAGTALGGLVAPPCELAALAALREGLGGWADAFFVGLVAQAFGALGTVLNRRSDRFSVDEREGGVRWAALTALVVSVMVFLGYALLGTPAVAA